MLYTLLVLLGCPAPSTSIVAVHEVYDVPPPPGQRTLQLDGVPPGRFALGSAVTVRDRAGTTLAVGDVVTDSVDPPSITVYVPEIAADAVLSAPGGLTAR
ncbi:MAG: hypothetical protein H6734_14675 [Alphaproteobacteria bacterium]|nr:hypothetical protein [Alphaproteobacteria bacterium]